MISSVYFYDEVGSQLFEEITRLPEYYLTRTEIPLLKKAASALSDTLRDVAIVEFGSGSCTKISLLLDAVPEKYRDTLCYIPFDVSSEAVEKSSHILSMKYPGIKIQGIVGDFMSQLDVIPKESKKVMCFLGSTIGNLPLEKAQRFLIDLSTFMTSGDLLLLGFDMVKSIEILEKAYNDSQNITEKFNKNILHVVNSHINSDFEPDNFDHVAFFNEKRSRIEMHLQAREDLEIVCPDSSAKVVMKKGETIHTESSYKFTEGNITNLAQGAGLQIQKQYTDKNNWFSLVVLEKNMCD
jgi:L-histidine N-alpha-methyltransferase